MNILEQAIQYTEKNLNQFKHNFSFIPEDKLNWTPSPSAKSPLQILAHVAVSANYIADWIGGKETKLTAEQLGAKCDAEEKELISKSAAFSVLESATSNALATMKKLTANDLEKIVHTPWMSAPLGMWVTLFWRHFDMHTGQIDYLQTCWNDQEFHFGG